MIGFSFSRCANRVAPTGGSKDTLSPYIISSVPLPLAKNYQGTKLYLVFNEWIKEKDFTTELLISPKINYKHKIKKNILEITFSEPLKKNTTYSFNFRQGIGDLNEGNIAIADTVSKQLPRIAFSTGDILDTLMLKGSVKSLFSGQIPKESIVNLYEDSDTLNIEKQTPVYFTLVDEKGNFLFTNVKEGKYRLFAWQEQNKNSTYQEGEPLGFVNEPIVLPKDEKKEFNLLLAKEDHQKAEISKEYMLNSHYEFEFREGISAVNIESKTKLYYTLDNKNLRIYTQEFSNDSIPVKMNVIDSSENVLKLDTKIFCPIPKTKKKQEKQRFDPKVELATGSGIEKDLELILSTEKPIISFFPEKLKYYPDKDTAKIQKLLEKEGQDWQWNTYKTGIKIKKNIKFKEKIEILADSVLFINVEKDSSNAFKKTFSIKNPLQFATISGSVDTKEPFYILQLINEKEEVVAFRNNVKKFNFEYLPASKYRFRIIIDKNNNGKWDNSDWKKKIEAENIIQLELKENGGKIKEKWDIEDVKLSF